MEIKIDEVGKGLYLLSISDGEYRGIFRHAHANTGMMYNTYLRDTGEGYILFGTPPIKYMEEWIRAMQRITRVGEIRWVVLFGEERDSSCVQKLYEKNSEITIFTGAGTAHKIKGISAERINIVEIRGERCFQFGKVSVNFKLFQDKFEMPTLYCLDQETSALLEADAIGSIGCFGKNRLSELSQKEQFYEGVRKYHYDIFGTKREAVLSQVCNYVRKEGISLICPGYGPVIDEVMNELLILLEEKKPGGTKPVLAIVYHDGKYIRELAEAIEQGAKESGKIEVWKLCPSETIREDILEKLDFTDAVLFGTSNEGGDVSQILWDIVIAQKPKACKGKIAGVFGWGALDGEYTESLKQRLSWLQYSLTISDFIIQECPDSEMIKKAYEYGFDMSCNLLHIPNPRKAKLVKCEVCGEIFDASLGTCPVCGVGLEQCTPVEENRSDFRKDTVKKYVIIGGGVSAVSAAEAIRQRDKTGSIVVVSAEKYLPINRPMLTKDIWTAGEHPEELQIHSKEWYKENQIMMKIGCSVTNIFTKEKLVKVETGERLHYDKLIYAAGAECFVPPFKGIDKPEVLTLRHVDDSKLLVKLMENGKNAVVIGGGVLGLEVANELMRSNIHVTVLEATPQIIGRQIDRKSADILKYTMEKMHVDCYEGVSIEEIEGDGHVTGVRIADGTVFPADFVVVSCGNRGNIQIARDAGIKCGRSIIVNSKMETSEKDIYACGDCAQFDEMNFQLWAEASQQGKTAGANAAGDGMDYVGELYGLSLEGFGTSVFALGDPGKKKNVRYCRTEFHDEIGGKEKFFWFSGHLLRGAVMIGCPEEVTDVSQWVRTHARYEDVYCE